MFALHHARLMAGQRPTGDADEIFDAHVLACLLANAAVEAAEGDGDLAGALGLDAATIEAVIDHWFPFAEAEIYFGRPAAAPTLEIEEEMLRDLLAAHARRGEGRAPLADATGPVFGAEPPLPDPPPRGGRGREGSGSSDLDGGTDAAACTGPAVTTIAAGSFPPPWRGRDREGGLGPTSTPGGASDTPDLAAILARVVARRAMRPDHLWQDLGLFDRSELGRLLARHFPALHAGNTTNMRWKKFFYRKLCEAEGFVLCTAPSCADCTDFAACFGAEDGESRMAKARREMDRAAAE